MDDRLMLRKIGYFFSLSVKRIAFNVANPSPQVKRETPSARPPATRIPSAPHLHASGFASLIAPAMVLSANALPPVLESSRQSTSYGRFTSDSPLKISRSQFSDFGGALFICVTPTVAQPCTITATRTTRRLIVSHPHKDKYFCFLSDKNEVSLVAQSPY